MLKNKSPYVKILVMVFIGLALSTLFGFVKPHKAEAAFGCSMNTPTRNGQQVTFSISWYVNPDQYGAPDYYEFQLDGGGYVQDSNGSKTYTFAYGSTHTVTGTVRFIGTQWLGARDKKKNKIFVTWKNGAVCGSRTYTMPNQQALAWITDVNCSATTGALTFTANVSDPDGGTPGYYLSIQNIGDTGWIYQSSGSYGHGPWYPPRNGATYSISIWASDAQTSNVIGPGVYYYSCPPAPQPPPSCSMTASPTTVYSGSSSTLSWTTTNATSFSVNQGVGSLNPVSGGSVSVNPGSSSKTYTGTASGAGGSITCSVLVTVRLGLIGCSTIPVSAMEPGDNYTPSVMWTYAGDTADVTVRIVVTVNGATSTYGPVSRNVPNGYSTTVSVGGGVSLDTVNDYTVQTQISGTVNGQAYGPTDCNGSVRVVVKPYFKIYGGDIMAGGVFSSGTCSGAPANSGYIYAFATGSGTAYRGASGQFGVTALMNINQLYSASNRTSSNPQPVGLTLSNTDGDGTYRGAFGGSGSCITDYFSDPASNPPNGGTRDSSKQGGSLTSPLSSVPGASKQYTLAGNSTIGSLSIPVGRQLAIYVDGNVYINGNISFDTGANTVKDMPNFALIVRGNIYIAPSVTRLDGLYVAQPENPANPSSGTKNGKFYTCAQGLNNLYSTSSLYGACNNNQLVINGAVIAQQVKFLRAKNTLKDSVTSEVPASFASGTATKAAEVINFNPELYLAPSPLKDPNDSGAKYDAIFSLPPVF